MEKQVSISLSNNRTYRHNIYKSRRLRRRDLFVKVKYHFYTSTKVKFNKLIIRRLSFFLRPTRFSKPSRSGWYVIIFSP